LQETLAQDWAVQKACIKDFWGDSQSMMEVKRNHNGYRGLDSLPLIFYSSQYYIYQNKKYFFLGKNS
jgi:hypothetical protein